MTPISWLLSLHYSHEICFDYAHSNFQWLNRDRPIPENSLLLIGIPSKHIPRTKRRIILVLESNLFSWIRPICLPPFSELGRDPTPSLKSATFWVVYAPPLFGVLPPSFTKRFSLKIRKQSWVRYPTLMHFLWWKWAGAGIREFSHQDSMEMKIGDGDNTNESVHLIAVTKKHVDSLNKTVTIANISVNIWHTLIYRIIFVRFSYFRILFILFLISFIKMAVALVMTEAIQSINDHLYGFRVNSWRLRWNFRECHPLFKIRKRKVQVNSITRKKPSGELCDDSNRRILLTDDTSIFPILARLSGYLLTLDWLSNHNHK
jgi:hypothetical protein